MKTIVSMSSHLWMRRRWLPFKAAYIHTELTDIRVFSQDWKLSASTVGNAANRSTRVLIMTTRCTRCSVDDEWLPDPVLDADSHCRIHAAAQIFAEAAAL